MGTCLQHIHNHGEMHYSSNAQVHAHRSLSCYTPFSTPMIDTHVLLL